MSGMFKTALRGLLAVAALLLVTTALSAPAEALNRTCAQKLVTSVHQVTICAEQTDRGNPYALAGLFTASPEPPSSMWAGLYQCNNSTGPYCILVSANSTIKKISDNKYQVKGSSVTYSPGHTYKACMSVGNVISNFCTKETT
jgi:hypothetical protein